MPDPIKPTQAAMAKAWSTWWPSVSTGVNDKHMQTAFEAGFEAGAQQAREQALEEAAKVAEAIVGDRGDVPERFRIATALRALKEQPPC